MLGTPTAAAVAAYPCYSHVRPYFSGDMSERMFGGYTYRVPGTMVCFFRTVLDEARRQMYVSVRKEDERRSYQVLVDCINSTYSFGSANVLVRLHRVRPPAHHTAVTHHA